MIVIGAVCAARNGRVIGSGRGDADLQFGVLLEAGALPHWTKVVVIVDDAQLLDELPERMFAAHDMPVDLIVTPTQLIRVTRPPKRPAGIDWRLIGPDLLRSAAVLCALMGQAFARHGIDPASIVVPTDGSSVGSALHQAIGKARAPFGPHGRSLRPQQPPPPPAALQQPQPQLVPVPGQTDAASTAQTLTMAAMMAQFSRDLPAPNRTKRLKQMENCISFTFSELPTNMTRHLLSQTIVMQLKRKAHYIKHSSESDFS